MVGSTASRTCYGAPKRAPSGIAAIVANGIGKRRLGLDGWADSDVANLDVSSHLMSEMALTAEHLIVIGQGRLLADDSVEAVVAARGQNSVHVRSPQSDQLAVLLIARGATPNSPTPGELTVTGVSTDESENWPPPTASPCMN